MTRADGSRENTSGECAVAGRVMAGGRPQAEATVMIVEGQVEHPDIAALSNEDGEYQLTGLSAGWYDIEARLGERTARHRVVLAPGQQTRVDISLD